MKKTTKILSAVLLCAVMIIMSVVPAFAVETRSIYGYREDHSIIDCANRYVEGSNYKFLIKTVENARLDLVGLIFYNDDGYVFYASLKDLSESTYATVNLEYTHSGNDYYMLTINTSSPSIPAGIKNKVCIKLFYDIYMATDTANGSFQSGPGYWLSI